MSLETYPPGFTDQDVLFECPKCGKSLGINRAGAGLIVSCSECGAKMRVPTPEDELAAEAADEPATDVPLASVSSGVAADEVQRLQVGMEELQERLHRLERMRAEYTHKFRRVGQEMELIQAALDRVSSILQDIGIDLTQE